MNSRADVQLGALLSRRRIKPGAVVTHWAHSKGEHAGELSKKEFRVAVQQLGLISQGPHAITSADIDKVFETFDSDGGGYMDADEAKEMVKGLQKIAEEAEHERWVKTREVCVHAYACTHAYRWGWGCVCAYSTRARIRIDTQACTMYA